MLLYVKGENMKKRFKIIVSALACLCSICMLMFGVYAASSPSVNLNGRVSYSVHDARVLVQGKINGAKETPTTVDYKQPANINNLTASDKLSTQSQFLNFTTGASLNNDTNDDLGTWNFGALNFYEDQNGIKTISVALKVTNLSLYPVNATLSNDMTGTTYQNVRYNASATQIYLSQYDLANPDASTGEFVIDFEVVDDSKNAFINNMNIVLKIEKTTALAPTTDQTKITYTYNKDLYNAYSVFEPYGAIAQTSPQGVAEYYQAEILQTATGEIVIPATYNDGIHGTLPVIPGRTKAIVEALSAGGSADAMTAKLLVPGVTKVTLMSGITETENLAFALLTGMTQISIPSTTIYHQGGTFAMSGLTSISLPVGTKSLPAYVPENYFVVGMFSNCTALSEVSLPQTLETIGCDAFKTCTALNSIYIPANVKSIVYAFSYNNLTSIVVSSQNAKYTSENGSNCIVDKTTNKLIAGCKTTVIPSYVTSIGGSGFVGIEMDSLTIPASVTTFCQESCGAATIGKLTIEGVITSVTKEDGDDSLFTELSAFNVSTISVIEFKSATPPTQFICFSNEVTTIYIPSGSLQAYTNACNGGGYNYSTELISKLVEK